MYICIYICIFPYIWIRFLRSVFHVPFLTFFPIFLLPLGIPIDSEIMDGFWHSRCLKDRIALLYMIGSLASGANASLVAKNGTKKLSQPFEEGFWFLMCLNDCVNLFDMRGLLAGGTTTPMVVIIWTKQPWVKIEYSRNFDRNFGLFRGKIWL